MYLKKAEIEKLKVVLESVDVKKLNKKQYRNYQSLTRTVRRRTSPPASVKGVMDKYFK